MITCGKQSADGDANWPNWFLGATTMGSNKGFSCFFFPQGALVAIVCLIQALPPQDTILSCTRYLKSRTGAAGAAAKLVFCAEQFQSAQVRPLSLSCMTTKPKLRTFLHQGDWHLINTLLSCSSQATLRLEYNFAHLEAPKKMQRF